MRSLVGFARACCAMAVAGAALAVPTAPAAALPDAPVPDVAAPDAPVPDAMPTAVLRLTAIGGPDDRGEDLGEAVLSCDPTAGDHPSSAAACQALKAVGGDFEKLPPRDGICIKVSQPVTAVAEGWYHGPVQFRKTYENPCVLRNALAPVFDFVPATVPAPGT
jgi:Subtilisin inhibitor-like